MSRRITGSFIGIILNIGAKLIKRVVGFRCLEIIGIPNENAIFNAAKQNLILKVCILCKPLRVVCVPV